MYRESIPNGVRFRVLTRDKFTCRYCGARPPDVLLEIDHVHPVFHGGHSTEDNLVTACRPCNRAKKHYLIEFPFTGQYVIAQEELAWLNVYRRHVEKMKVWRDGLPYQEEDELATEWMECDPSDDSGLLREFPDDFYEKPMPPVDLEFDWRKAAAETPTPDTWELLVDLPKAEEAYF